MLVPPKNRTRTKIIRLYNHHININELLAILSLATSTSAADTIYLIVRGYIVVRYFIWQAYTILTH